MKKNHTNEFNCTKLAMPRQLVLPLEYGLLIKETAPFLLINLVELRNGVIRALHYLRRIRFVVTILQLALRVVPLMRWL